MKFRQRLAWIAVVFYLGSSFGVLYYLFEVNEQFNKLGLEHVEKEKSKSDTKFEHEADSEKVNKNAGTSVWLTLTSVPMSVWFVILLIPYLQIFAFMLACTKAEPKLSLAFIWPGVVYLKYRQILDRCCLRTSSKAVNSTVYSNGHVILET